VAKSTAKKLREKLTREGKMNPEAKRSPFVFSNMRTRTTKTKKDHLYQFKHKDHQSQQGNDGSFYFMVSAFGFLLFYIKNRFMCKLNFHPAGVLFNVLIQYHNRPVFRNNFT
jgi:hypothetical protein